MIAKRKQVVYSFTSVEEVDVDFQINSPWSLIDVSVNFNTAVTVTAEECTFYRRDSDSNDWYHGGFDPKDLSGNEATSKVCRFDKKFQAGDTLRIDYPNTDQKTIKVCIQYEKDYRINYEA